MSALRLAAERTHSHGGQRDVTLVFFFRAWRPSSSSSFVGYGDLRQLLNLAGVRHVVRRRLDLARHEPVNALGPHRDELAAGQASIRPLILFLMSEGTLPRSPCGGKPSSAAIPSESIQISFRAKPLTTLCFLNFGAPTGIGV